MRSYLLICFLLMSYFSASAQLEKQSGTASFYGKRFHGRTTANGEAFDMNKMTAAHRTLPFGTIVKVTRPDNGRFIFVRINDRGPFYRNRIIDLSRKAAEKLGIIRRGHQKVVMEVMEDGVLAKDISELPAHEVVYNRLPERAARQIDRVEEAAGISPVLKSKPVLEDLPVKAAMPETFIKKLLREVLPES